MRLSSNRLASLRRFALAGAALTALVIAPDPRSANAQWAVNCVNCSTTWTQLLQYAKEAQSLATQLQQYQTQLEQYANMVTNTVALPQEIWGTVQSDIMQIQTLSNAASLLSGNSGSMISRLQSASAYANQVGSLGNIAGQFGFMAANDQEQARHHGAHAGSSGITAAEPGRDPPGSSTALAVRAGPDAGNPGRQ